MSALSLQKENRSIDRETAICCVPSSQLLSKSLSVHVMPLNFDHSPVVDMSKVLRQFVSLKLNTNQQFLRSLKTAARALTLLRLQSRYSFRCLPASNTTDCVNLELPSMIHSIKLFGSQCQESQLIDLIKSLCIDCKLNSFSFSDCPKNV